MTSSKRKVCIYCEKWMLGGIEAFLAAVLAHMDCQGLELHLAVAAKQPGVFQEELDRARVTVHILQKRAGTSAFGHTFFSLVPFWSLLKQEKFDVVHLNLFHAVALAFAFLAYKAGVPTIIVHSHGAGFRKSRLYCLKMMAHRLCRALFSGVPVVRWAASEAAGRFMFPAAKQVTVIPNGIDTGRFLFSEVGREAVRRELGIQDAYVIGCVGRLDSQKNQIFLLDVMANCRKICANAVLLLVGDGEERKALEWKVEQLGVGPYVFFLGESSSIPSLMCAMDVIAVPSQSEGLSIVTLEAQAAGLPAVCSTGVPEEVKVTDLVTYLPLQAGPKRWAEVLLSQEPSDRGYQNKLVRHSKFQIESSAELVHKAYEGKP